MTKANNVIAEGLNREVQDLTNRSVEGVAQEDRECEASMGRSLSPQEKEGPPNTATPGATTVGAEPDRDRSAASTTPASTQSGTDSAVSDG